MLCTSPQNITVTYELMLFGFTWYLGIHRWVAFNWAWVKGSHKFSMRNLFVKYALNLKIWSQHMTWNSVLLQLLHEAIRLLIVQLTVWGPHPPQAYQSCYSGGNDLPGVFYSSFISCLAFILSILFLTRTSTTKQATEWGPKIQIPDWGTDIIP